MSKLLDYSRLFGRGFLMVFLVSANTYFISHFDLLAAGGVGMVISVIWFGNARTAGRSRLPGASFVYGAGAGVGTMVGMSLARFVLGV